MNRQLPQTQNRTFVYSYDGTNIVAQEVTNGTSLDYEHFFYDASGSPVGMNYLGNNYLFKKNLQGDIIEIWGTADGSSRSDFRKLVTYTYDAWGNITSMVDTTDNWYRVGTANPFRYRGYYYDNESGLYYVSSRYYDPEIGRWLNSDDPRLIVCNTDIPIDYNLFVYCFNEPIQGYDPSGESPFKIVGAGIQIEICLGAFTGGLEVIWFFSSQVNVSGRSRSIPYIYVYGGGGIGPSDQTKNILKKIISKPSLLFNPKSLARGFSLSVCVFAIFGYSNFRNPKNYLGAFNETYASAWHVNADADAIASTLI